MKTRPVFLNLLLLRFPVMAIVSILHRITGVILFALFPVYLCFLYQLSSPSSVDLLPLESSPQHILCQLTVWVFLASLGYHVLAGIRHLLMDMGWGETLPAGRVTAWLVLLGSLILTGYWGYRIWL